MPPRNQTSPSVGEQVDHLVVLRLVDEVAVGVLNAADLVDVLLDRELVFELVDPRGQVRQYRSFGNVSAVLACAV